MLQYEYRSNRVNQRIEDTISTYVIWVPDSHFDEYGRCKYSMKDYCRDSTNVDECNNFSAADSVVVLGVLHFIKNED